MFSPSKWKNLFYLFCCLLRNCCAEQRIGSHIFSNYIAIEFFKGAEAACMVLGKSPAASDRSQSNSRLETDSGSLWWK